MTPERFEELLQRYPTTLWLLACTSVEYRRESSLNKLAVDRLLEAGLIMRHSEHPFTVRPTAELLKYADAIEANFVLRDG